VPAGEPVPADFSIEGAVNAWAAAGAPLTKLVIGIPYYGQGWTGVSDSGGTGLFQPATGPAAGTFAPGTEDYKVLAPLAGNGFRVRRDFRAGHAWLFDGTTLWTFDDPLVVLQKALYIRARGLGGAMAWELSGDDANATLTRTISAGLHALS
jgi:chitinase